MNREKLSSFIDFVRSPKSPAPTLPFSGAYILKALEVDLPELQYLQLASGELWSYRIDSELFNMLPEEMRRNIMFKVLDFALVTCSILWLPAVRLECPDQVCNALIEYKPEDDEYWASIARAYRQQRAV